MIDNLGFAVDGGWKVLSVGLLLGAGLPLVFALGIRSLAVGVGATRPVPAGTGPGPGPHGVGGTSRNPLGLALAGLCFAFVLSAVALGITVIVAAGFAHQVSFEQGYPTIVPKE